MMSRLLVAAFVAIGASAPAFGQRGTGTKPAAQPSAKTPVPASQVVKKAAAEARLAAEVLTLARNIEAAVDPRAKGAAAVALQDGFLADLRAAGAVRPAVAERCAHLREVAERAAAADSTVAKDAAVAAAIAALRGALTNLEQQVEGSKARAVLAKVEKALMALRAALWKREPERGR